MSKQSYKKIAFVAFITLVLMVHFAAPVYALNPDIYPPSTIDLPGNSQATATGFITDIINKILLPLTGIIAVFFIILGGFRYITSAGNDEAAESAKKMITNAVIGLVVVILSYVVIRVVITTINI